MNEPKKVLCVTANPCVDRVVWYRESPDRPTRVFRQLGGKGVNVSRMLGWLGHRVVSLTFGGKTEQALAGREPCRTILAPAAHPIRVVPLYINSAEKTSRLDYVSTNRVTPEEAGSFLDRFREELKQGPDIVIISGSACTGAGGTFPVIARLAKEKGLPLILDSYGQPFLDALPAGPDYVKPNREELEQAVGPIPPGEEVAAAGKLIQKGAGCVLLTMGEKGSYCVTRDKAIFCPVFPVPTVSAVGCGDTFVAYFTHGLLSGWPLERCFQVGNAAGAANATQSISGRTRASQVDRVLKRAKLPPLEGC